MNLRMELFEALTATAQLRPLRARLRAWLPLLRAGAAGGEAGRPHPSRLHPIRGELQPPPHRGLPHLRGHRAGNNNHYIPPHTARQCPPARQQGAATLMGEYSYFLLIPTSKIHIFDQF